MNPEGEKGKAAVGRICRKERIDKAACSLYNNNQTMKYVPEVTKTTLNLDKIRKNKEKEREKKTLSSVQKAGERRLFAKNAGQQKDNRPSNLQPMRTHNVAVIFFWGGEKL